MASLTTIKRRIASINSTAKITNAMYLVASSKLKRVRNKYEQIKPYFSNFYSIIGLLLSTKPNLSFLNVKKAKKATLYIQINSSMGLCGAYNSNINKIVKAELRDNDKLICLGKKGYEFWKNESNGNGKIIKSIDVNENNLNYEICEKLANDIFNMYKNGEINCIKLVFTKFVNALVFNPTIISILPFDNNTIETLTNHKLNIKIYEFEPSEANIIKNLIPQYMASIIYGSLIESKISECGARRNAMDTATTNAIELERKYRLAYNAARQSKITNEIIEIVAGSNNEKE